VTLNSKEGPETAAEDFATARFNIAEKNRRIGDVETSRGLVMTTMVAATMIVAALVIALYVIRVPRSSPLRLSFGSLGLVDIGAVLAVGAFLGAGFRSLSRKRKELSDLKLQVTKLREAERDARSRIPTGGTTRLLWSYHSDVLITIENYRSGARAYRRVHNRFQTVIIIGSLLTTALGTAAAKYGSLGCLPG
jgi:hypothetical protein